MNIYEIEQLEREIDLIASQNDGEIPEEKLRELVEAQTKSIVQIEKLCRYIRHLEMFVETAIAEKERINGLQNRAKARIANIKKHLTPYVLSRGKFDAGTFSLSTKKSESVELVDGFSEKLSDETRAIYCRIEIIATPDKKKIKEALEKDIDIPGAKLTKHDNLQIK